MKIKVTFSDLITTRDIKAVRAYAKEQKPELEEMARETIKAVEKELNISFLGEIREVEATYYNTYKRPVFSIVGEATDRNISISEPGYWLYVRSYKTLDESSCAANIYRREI